MSVNPTMVRRSILIASLSLATLAFAQQTTVPPLPSKKDAAAILQKAEEQTRINSAGRPPFRLIAKLHYTSGKTTMNGAYEVLWQAPDRFREEFALGPFSESDVAVPGKLYVLRNTPLPALALWRLRALTGLPTQKAAVPIAQIAKVLPQKNSAGSVWCFEWAPPFSPDKECVDALTGGLISVSGKGLGVLAEDHFVSVGSSNYATHMLSTIGNDSIEVNVDRLEQVDGFADGILSPPNGATSSDWCPNPSATRDDGQELTILTAMVFGGPEFTPLPTRDMTGYYLGPQFPPPRTRDLTGYYLKVGTDGAIKLAAEMHPDGTARRIELVGARDVRLPVHSCAGTPIEYETIMGGPISR
jgi:hypothetical protein